MAALANAGHHAIYQSTRESDYKKVLKKPTDLVLVAGGDGTVGKVGCELIDSGISLSVLPLGTANNLARSLGFIASPEEIISGLEGGKRRAFDVGLARGPWGKRYFFESAGGGLLADYLRGAKGKAKKTEKLSEEQEMRRHVSLLRRILHDYPARKWKMDIDGEDISDDYIVWEAMNIRLVGPVLYLASQAATKDGQLDFVCAREDDRSLLMEYLDARLAGSKSKFPLPLRRFRRLRIVCKKFDASLRQQSLAVQKPKGEKPERNRNHGETVGAGVPATGTRSAKIGLIAGRIRCGERPRIQPPVVLGVKSRANHVIATKLPNTKIDNELRITAPRNSERQS
jgi:diacylglycerol kinase (ATP)